MINIYFKQNANICEMHTVVHERNTRKTDSLSVYVPKPNHECYQISFKYASGKTWNGVPNNIQNAPIVEPFKYDYKKHTFKIDCSQEHIFHFVNPML